MQHQSNGTWQVLIWVSGLGSPVIVVERTCEEDALHADFWVLEGKKKKRKKETGEASDIVTW